MHRLRQRRMSDSLRLSRLQHMAVEFTDSRYRFILQPFIPHSPHDLEAWPRDFCHVVEGSASTDIPIELAVEAQCNRLVALEHFPQRRVSQGFSRERPPPVPLDTVSFRAEWLTQDYFNRIGRSLAYYLSADAWDHDIPILMSERGYVNARTRLFEIAQRSVVEIRGERVDLLVESAAEREHAEGIYPGTSRETVSADLARLKRSWTVVLHMVGEYMRVRIQFRFLAPPHKGS